MSVCMGEEDARQPVMALRKETFPSSSCNLRPQVSWRPKMTIHPVDIHDMLQAGGGSRNKTTVISRVGRGRRQRQRPRCRQIQQLIPSPKSNLAHRQIDCGSAPSSGTSTRCADESPIWSLASHMHTHAHKSQTLQSHGP